MNKQDGRWVTIRGNRVFLKDKNELANLKSQYQKLLSEYYSSSDYYDFGTENKLEEMANRIAELEKQKQNNDFMNQKIKAEWNGKNDNLSSHMSDDTLKNEIRDIMQENGALYPVSVNGKTTGFFNSPHQAGRVIGREAIEVETSGPGAKLNSKIWSVKIFDKNATTKEDKETIKKLKQIFKDYL